jgi:hypothetical protein|tara:strand:+ start:1340 stop:1870 length:531 start_codon:yes stop_codon:yes gene_type:complete
MAEQPKMNPAMMSASRTMGSTEPTVHEIFTLINNAKDKPKKIAVLKKHDTQAMRQLLKAAFDPNIQFDLPEGTPPFIANEAPAGTEHTSLFYASKKLWRFVKGADETINRLAKEKMFLGLLESLHEKDAHVLIGIKDQKLNNMYKGLTATVVKDAFNWNDDFMQQTNKSILKELLS